MATAESRTPPKGERQPVEAVIFDLDGVLLDSEQVWDAVRERLTRERGGHWTVDAQAAMMGMSSTEWSRYMAGELGVSMEPAAISSEAVARVTAAYRESLPLINGAVEVIKALAGHWPLGLASSSNRPMIDLVLELASLTDYFRVTVSSEEVAHGKPAPDVYLEAAARLQVEPQRCAAVEDSANGLRSASTADMWVVAVPNRRYPPPHEVIRTADLVVGNLLQLTPEAIQSLGRPT